MLISPEGAFTTGLLRYSDTCPGVEDPLARIYVPFKPDGANTWFLALLDTGGHFCVLARGVAGALQQHLTGGLEQATLMTSRGRIRGRLYRHRIDLIADDGNDLGVEATVLVSLDWNGPSIIGYTGMLDRIRFAVDPPANQFHFGPLA